MKMNQILCPIDYSAASKAALTKAVQLARRQTSTLHIIHVYELLFADGYMDGMSPMPAVPDTEALKKHLTDIRPQGVKLVHDLIFGIPASSIVTYADSNDIDLIVMGTHRKTPIGRLLMGSVAESVMRAAPCPVLVVHDRAAVEKAADPSAPETPTGVTFVF